MAFFSVGNLIYVVVCIISLSILSAQGSCPLNWVSYDEFCYFKYLGGPLTLFEARAACREKHSELTSVHNAAEQSFITDFARPEINSHYIWIGLTDVRREGSWEWDDGTPYNGEFSNWGSGQPDNYGNVEDCGHMRNGEEAGLWNDISCRNPIAKGYICKMRIPGQNFEEREISLQGKPTTQSSTHDPSRSTSDKAVDGDTNGYYFSNSCTHTSFNKGQGNPWWVVDMEETFCVGRVVIYNRADCCGERLDGAIMRVGPDSVHINNPECVSRVSMDQIRSSRVIDIECSSSGRYLSVELPHWDLMTLCEVKAYSCRNGSPADTDFRTVNATSTTITLAPKTGMTGTPTVTVSQTNNNLTTATTFEPPTGTTEHVCEWQTLFLSCPWGKAITVLSASYGRTTTTACPVDWHVDTNCYASSSMREVRSRCQGRRSCEVLATNSVFTDPCVGTFKYLEVTYDCFDDKQSTVKNTTSIPQTTNKTNAASIFLVRHASDFISPCKCKNGGSCTPTGSGFGFVCNCPPGYGGYDCSQANKDEIRENDPCKNDRIVVILLMAITGLLLIIIIGMALTIRSMKKQSGTTDVIKNEKIIKA